MKRLVTLFFVLAVCGTGAVAQEGAYKTVKDIAYRDAAGDGNIDTMCRLDIFYPVGKTGFSTVVWYHGGGLTGGRREIPEALKDKGLAVVGVEYRLSPTVKVADCVDDAAAAAAWVVKHIASYGGDPGRVFVAGHSVNLQAAQHGFVLLPSSLPHIAGQLRTNGLGIALRARNN